MENEAENKQGKVLKPKVIGRNVVQTKIQKDDFELDEEVKFFKPSTDIEEGLTYPNMPMVTFSKTILEPTKAHILYSFQSVGRTGEEAVIGLMNTVKIFKSIEFKKNSKYNKPSKEETDYIN